MDSILFYGDRGEATRRQVRSAAASHSHRIGPRKAKASKKPKVEQSAQPARKRKLKACAVTSDNCMTDKTSRPSTRSLPKVDNGVLEKQPRTAASPPRQEASPSPTASSLDAEMHGRDGPIRMDLPRIEQQSYTYGQLPSMKTDYLSPSPSVPSPLLDRLPRSDPYQHPGHDSTADPLMVTRIHPRVDPPRYERSFDGRLHLALISTNPSSHNHCTPPALRVLPEPRPYTRPISQSSEISSDQGMRTPRRSSGNLNEDVRHRDPSAG